MSFLSLNGHPILRGKISLPRIGAWHADLLIDHETDLAGEALLKVGSELTLTGTVRRSLAYSGVSQVRVGAGADGLWRAANPKHYANPAFRLPLADLLADAGEAVGEGVDEAILNRSLPAWTTVRMPVGQMLLALCATQAELAWRLLPQGGVWVGIEAWPVSSVTEYREIKQDGRARVLELGLDSPIVLPGTTLGDWRLDYVEHIIEPDLTRTIAWVSE